MPDDVYTDARSVSIAIRKGMEEESLGSFEADIAPPDTDYGSVALIEGRFRISPKFSFLRSRIVSDLKESVMRVGIYPFTLSKLDLDGTFTAKRKNI